MNGTARHILLGVTAALLPAPLAAPYASDAPLSASAHPLVLKAEAFRHYVEDFNKNDNELYQGFHSRTRRPGIF